MANKIDLMLRDLANSPKFVEQFLPAAGRTALLYHLSYLRLANFPKVERILRQRALETQHLFGSSEAVLLKCVTTSDDLVSSLLPMLRLSVENNQTVLAVKSLENARTGINEIIEGVKKLIKSYRKHTKDVSASASYIKSEKAETEKERADKSDEIKSLEKILAKFQGDLNKNSEEMGKTESKIQETYTELQNHVSNICLKSQSMGFLGLIVPFVGPIIKSIYDTATAPDATAKTQALTNDLSRLSSEKSNLRNKDWNIQVKMTELQLKLATLKIQEGTIPDPVHLVDVQKSLSQIQKILIQLQRFWMSVGELLNSLKKKTSVGEYIIDDNMNEKAKSFFLKSIEIAEEYWKIFSQGCLKAQNIFSLQTKDAYKFLESVPPVGSDEWKQEYDSVMEKLKKINPEPLCAITE